MATAYSSQGSFTFDQVTGKVLSHSLKNDFGQVPLTVDVIEYQQFYGHQVNDGVDVLDIGFWSVDGIYTPPTYDWREDLRLLKADEL